jgi:hypothetical protein
MKKTAALLIAIALCSTAHAEPLYVYQREPNKPSAIHHGLANGVPVLIQIYGEDSIREAQACGRTAADIDVPFSEAARRIRVTAESTYPGKAAMIGWFERDAAAAFDKEKARVK